MRIYVTKEVANWYKDELNLNPGNYIRFCPRYGGVGGPIPGFSLGINTKEPIEWETIETVKGISFYIEEQDTWYFEDKDLKITMNLKLNEPEFAYI